MLKKLLPLSLLLLAYVAPTRPARLVAPVPPVRPAPFAPPAGVPAPAAAPTIGFFLNEWQAKTFQPPAFTEVRPPAAAPTAAEPTTASAAATVSIDADSTITRIPLSEFGHNAVTWMGPTADQKDVMTNLSNLNPHVIRWPAGSGSDVYFWNCAPGQIPADVPWMMPDKDGKKKAVNFFLGRPTGRYLASLDDYYAMLAKTHNQGLITVNYGYARYGTSANPVAAAAHLAADWVRYDHGRTRYWEIGNENFGNWEQGYRIDTTANKDGQPKILTGELYGRHFLVFADSMRQAAAEVGARIFIGAVMHDSPPQFWDPPTTRNWNPGMIKSIHDQADYYVVHSYFTPWNQNTPASEILRAAAAVPGRMMDYVLKCLKDENAAIKPIAMDEWNMFAVGSHQQVSNISGLFGVIVLGEALQNKYGLAARWDLFNGWAGGNDHGIFSAGDEPGVQRWTPRPSFYYLYYLQRMTGDRLIKATVSDDSSLHAYASRFSSGELGAALVNTAATATTVTLDARHFSSGMHYYWYSLQGGDDNGEFSGKVFINGQGPTGLAGGPVDYASIKANAASSKDGIRVTVPARGAVFLVIASSSNTAATAPR